MEKRRGATHAAFLFPYLKDDSRILDCGCGPGTITNDLAARVENGFVVGIDIKKSQAQRAQQLARESKIRNVFYIEQEITALGFSDDTFDVVFSEALLDHVSDTEKAISEMVRVLRPGGILALRSPEWSRLVFNPPTADGAFFIEEYRNCIARAGGQPHLSQKLPLHMKAAGLEDIRVSYGQETHNPANSFVMAVSEPVMSNPENLSGASRNEAEARHAKAQEWANQPHATIQETWIECVGTKHKS